VFIHERPVRFEEVDAAGIVFFARFFGYCHEAMEALLGAVPGGYAGLVLGRKIGFPAVHVEADFASPLRFGDVAHIEVVVERLGKSSCALRNRFTRLADGVSVATILHVCAVSDLTKLRAVAIPDDVRAVLAAHGA
jgi:YbgC/YbaW family acyl-CoA thioester hydrolase